MRETLTSIYRRRPPLDLSSVTTVVIDEINHALTDAFRKDIEDILTVVGSRAQKVLVSATADSKHVSDFASQWLNSPLLITVDEKETMPQSISHYFVTVPRQKKVDCVRRLM